MGQICYESSRKGGFLERQESCCMKDQTKKESEEIRDGERRSMVENDWSKEYIFLVEHYK